jgi:short-subunit dehydrogenase
MKRLLILGASRGLGAALAAGLPQAGDELWLVSRTQPAGLDQPDGVLRHWLKVDLAEENCAQNLSQALRNQALDVVIYNAGIWEKTAFSSAYQFERVPAGENQRILTVNLLSAIHCLQVVIPHLRQSANGKIILIGSTSGLENSRAPEVAYNASKFGLRGVAHALREQLRPDAIGVTCLNPGSLNTAGGHDPSAIPMSDMVAIVQMLINLSPYTCIKEMDIPAMVDVHV